MKADLVAASLYGDKKAVGTQGYRAEKEGTILRSEEENNKMVRKLLRGARRAILNDLSPGAAFIAYKYITW
ncbi:MAG: hypothetical protein K6U74_13265 [Firmicutes bacterium]|nr:hypothetical protein [Bacillota bacterium]